MRQIGVQLILNANKTEGLQPSGCYWSLVLQNRAYYHHLRFMLKKAFPRYRAIYCYLHK